MKIKESKFFFLCTLYFVLCAYSSFSQNYFQQEVKYTINVSLNDVKHELSAFETITYINNSPDELREIYFHLWPNAYKNTETVLAKQFEQQGNRKMLDMDESDLGFIDSLNFTVDGETVQWVYDSLHIDICKIILNHPLKSGDSIFISTPFHVKIPSGAISRMGHIGQSYQITQWYPKPAVYDKYGWHPMPYLDMGEFYSEFGSFDVSITLPKNYVVGATGDLQTESEKIFLQEKVEETKNISVYSTDNSFPKSDSETKTIRFTQKNVHDFAWFADKRFHVLKREVKLPHEKRTVTSWIMFTNNQPELWKNALQYVNDATYYYSEWLGDYPYNNVTAVDGTISAGGGMEYPNITVIGDATDANELEIVIAHEVGHNWLYGVLGSNERDHAWMDEGINTFYELRYVDAKYDSGKSAPSMFSETKFLGLNRMTDRKVNELQYLFTAKRNTDQPLNITSEKFARLNYGAGIYSKTGLSFQYLRAYLGDSLFDKCMRTYFVTWKFRHPYSDDLKNIFESVTQKNLSWFFDDLLKTTKKIDYAIASAKQTSEEAVTNFEITLKNKGGIDGPVSLSGVDENGKTLTTTWIDSIGEKKNISFTCAGCSSIRIDNDQNIPEINRSNNSIRTKGILRKWDKLHLQFAGGFEKPNTSQIFYLPTLGWNNYDKLMTGIALHNIFLPEKKFEYVLMPMYSTRTNTLVGGGNISYNFYNERKTGKKHKIQKATLELSGQSYHYADFTNTSVNRLHSEKETFRFIKLRSEMIFSFNPSEENSGYESSLHLRVTNTRTEYPFSKHYGGFTFNSAGTLDSNQFHYTIKELVRYFPEIFFTGKNRKAINPFSWKLGFRMDTKDKLFRAVGEANYRFSYKGKNRGFDMRMFIGAVGSNSSEIYSFDYRLQMSGYSTNKVEGDFRADDYLYDHVLLGRSEADGIMSKQFVAEDGGFKVLAVGLESSSWLLALNFKTSIPGRLPVKLFADIGVYDESNVSEDFKQGLIYDYGAELTIIPDIFSVYFPLGYSDGIRNYFEEHDELFGKWTQRIRFELRLEKLNPIKLIRTIDF